MADGTPTHRTSIRQWSLACLLLIISYFCLRLPHLRDWPMFCDEATYARWAQCLLEDPVHNLWVSMADAKPPIHTWLLAITRPIAADPITAGRILSVLFGAATIPFILLLCGELARLAPFSQRRGLLLGILSSALIITSPLLAIHQRMGIAESILIFEAIILGWLSLTLARSIAENAPTRSLTKQGLILGLCWGLTLLTKQNFSYLLWSLPPAAMLAWSSRENRFPQIRRFIVPFALATTIGLAMFIPVLFTNTSLDLKTRLFYKSDFYPRQSRVESAFDNIGMLMSPYAEGHPQWWPYDPAHPLDGGWLYVYLTPPVFALVIAALLWMAHRRAWRPMFFLGVWSFALIGSLALVGGTIWSRYLVLGILPLLLLVAWLMIDLLEFYGRKLSANAFQFSAAIAAAVVLAWPTCIVTWSAFNWQAPVLVSADVGQYITRQCAGPAAEQAVAWVKARANEGPMTVITGCGIGLPNDLVWLGLRDHPNVHLYWDGELPPLKRTGKNPDVFLLGTERWIGKERSPVLLPPQCPVYMVVPRLYDPIAHSAMDIVQVADLPRDARIVKIFQNPAKHDANEVLQLVVLEMPPVNRTAVAKGGDERVAVMSH
ncbi:MAG TPA: glycosyltransferase family 39 protein [Phycisphaerae bacterium]|nr:glycosyltransferase family 39 protein [Phycisphaerae bacterium]